MTRPLALAPPGSHRPPAPAQGMDWDCLQQRALHPPYQPTVQSVDDTSNFAGQEETTPIDDSRPYDAKRYERLFGDFEAVAV